MIFMKHKRKDDRISKIDYRINVLVFVLSLIVAFLIGFTWFLSTPILLSPYTQIIVSWTDASNNEDGFIVERSLDSGFSNPVSACILGSDVESCSELISGLLPNTQYHYRVRAYNSVGSSPSQPVSVTTPPAVDCVPGEIRSCYTGPAGTLGVGICSAGTEVCVDSGFGPGGYGVWSGVCTGQVTPSLELCVDASFFDEDCDGNTVQGGVNCGDLNSCSTHPTCVAPTITGFEIDGVAGNVLTSNIPHVLTILGSGFHSDAIVTVGVQQFPSSLYTVSSNGNSIDLQVPAIPGFIDPSVEVSVTNPNSPNPSLSFTDTFVIQNPIPVASSISPSGLNNPSVGGVTELTITGSGFVPNTDVEVTFPAIAGFPPLLFSDFGIVPYDSPTTLKFLFSHDFPEGIYSFKVLNPSALGGNFESSAVTFSLSLASNPVCSLNSPTPGCPIINSISPTSVSNNDGQVVVSGISDLPTGLFNTDYVLEIQAGLVTLPTTVTNAGATLTATIPNTIAPGSYAANIRNTQNSRFSNSVLITVTEDLPVISSVVPNSVNVNSPISLGISGTGFYPNSIVSMTDGSGNIVPVTTTSFISNTQLSFSVTSTNVVVGSYGIQVTNPGATVSNIVPFNVNSVCGDGATTGSEICDDGDSESGDGCSSTCQVESGYTCIGVPSICTLLCGNGVVDSGETCGEPSLATCGSGFSCSTVLCQCQGSGTSPSNPSNPVSGGGSGGSGGGSSGRSVPTPQCNNGRDDDGDGLIDYSTSGTGDPGCSSRTDSSEVNVVPTSTPPTSGATPPIAPDVTPSNDVSSSRGFFSKVKEFFVKDGQFRAVYWSVILVLTSGILVIVILIVRSLRMKARFMALATAPPTGA